MTRRLVITGATGFVGTHVARLAAEAGWRVIAVGRDAVPRSELAHYAHEYIGVDLADRWPIPPASADAVIHLAGLAAVGRSFSEPQRYIDVNSAMMTQMAEELVREEANTRVVVVSSGAVYESPTDARPITEDATLRPSSPYAVAKILVETQARYYATRGLDVVVARPFNHIGPGQGRGFLVPDLVTALRGLTPGRSLSVGNLETSRDYTDVRDVAAAYLLLAEAPEHRFDTYNVASGTSRSGHAILGSVAAALGIPVPRLEVDPGLLRPGDPPTITGSAARLRDEFGWMPTIDPSDSIREYVAHAEP